MGFLLLLGELVLVFAVDPREMVGSNMPLNGTLSSSDEVLFEEGSFASS